MIEVTRGDGPVVLGLPHTGTDVPEDVMADLNETGRALADTDWHIHQLYADLLPGVTSVRTKIHRYVIDVNRDPEGVSLYPEQNTTGLCPLTDFDGRSIYQDGKAPDEAEISRRRATYHTPYHNALSAELERVKARHGFVVLYDCHSIRSHIPYLFEGRLPDFNIGDNGGTTCDASITSAVTAVCETAAGYSHVVNGRFKGGWTTRHYGRPADSMHAIQMELAQSTYVLERAPWNFDRVKSGTLRTHLKSILNVLLDWRPS